MQILTEELGFDVALNRTSPDFRAAFTAATAERIDVYFDNSGGDEGRAQLTERRRTAPTPSRGYEGLGAAPSAFVDLLGGQTVGTTIVRLGS